jgi:hypothetical protein
MPRGCSICNLGELGVHTINQAIAKGVPQSEIVTMIQNDFGIKITKQSLSRHTRAHTNIKRPTATADDIEKTRIPPKEVEFVGVDEYRERAKNIVTDDLLLEEDRVARLMLAELQQNQLAIVLSKQKAYMAGDTNYPREEIQGLKTIRDLTDNAFKGWKSSSLQGSRQYDLEVKRRRFVSNLADELLALGEYRVGLYYENFDEDRFVYERDGFDSLKVSGGELIELMRTRAPVSLEATVELFLVVSGSGRWGDYPFEEVIAHGIEREREINEGNDPCPEQVYFYLRYADDLPLEEYVPEE